MKLKVLYLILFFAVAGIGECRSHAGGEQIRLSLDTLVQKEFPSRCLPRVKRMWVNKSDSALADSILYDIGLYNVVVKKDREKILYNICRKYNPEISSEYLLSFQMDSIRSIMICIAVLASMYRTASRLNIICFQVSVPLFIVTSD